MKYILRQKDGEWHLVANLPNIEAAATTISRVAGGSTGDFQVPIEIFNEAAGRYEQKGVLPIEGNTQEKKAQKSPRKASFFEIPSGVEIFSFILTWFILVCIVGAAIHFWPDLTKLAASTATPSLLEAAVLPAVGTKAAFDKLKAADLKSKDEGGGSQSTSIFGVKAEEIYPTYNNGALATVLLIVNKAAYPALKIRELLSRICQIPDHTWETINGIVEGGRAKGKLCKASYTERESKWWIDYDTSGEDWSNINNKVFGSDNPLVIHNYNQ